MTQKFIVNVVNRDHVIKPLSAVLLLAVLYTHTDHMGFFLTALPSHIGKKCTQI